MLAKVSHCGFVNAGFLLLQDRLQDMQSIAAIKNREYTVISYMSLLTKSFLKTSMYNKFPFEHSVRYCLFFLIVGDRNFCCISFVETYYHIFK